MSQFERILGISFAALMACLPLQAADQAGKAAEAPKKEAAKPKMTKEELFSDASIKKISETYGFFITKGLDNPVIKLNFDSVIQGMKEAKAGKAAPMNEQEYEEAINLIQEYAYQDMATKNLADAEKFLKENAKKEGVKELDGGKLQYQVLQEGTGEVITDALRPTIQYTGKYIDGTVFGSSDTSGPLSLSLNQVIPGFRKGILGMKVGEKRRLFIHPELGYGMSGQLLPNSLLIFDIEVTSAKPEEAKKEKPAEKGSSKLAQNSSDDDNEFDDSDDQDDEDDANDDDIEALAQDEGSLFPDSLDEGSDDEEDFEIETDEEELPAPIQATVKA